MAAFASFYIPNRYVSTAVLWLVSADPRAPDSVQAAAAHMPEMFQQVLSRDSLAEIIQQPELQLYTQERARRSLDEVIKQMRDRDLRVEPLREFPFGGRPTAFRISFEYSDPAKAGACVQAVVSRIVERSASAPPQRTADNLFDNNLADHSLPLNPEAVHAPPSGPTLPIFSPADIPTGTTASPFAFPIFSPVDILRHYR